LKCIIVGTDGVFEGLEPQEALNCVVSKDDPQDASEALTKESLIGMDNVEVDDNTTNIVLFIE
jgi:serine/threonine protein phosphatase PrpC